MQSTSHFDTGYYRRFYEDADTAILDAATATREVAFVVAFCNYIGLAIERFTDVGAGTGWWATEFAKQYPACGAIETLDSSKAACDLYGHRRMAIEKLAGRQSDLVVCRDVLRYVDDSVVDEAMRRLAKKCRGVLYIHAITSDDDIDEDASDMEGVFRSTWFYRDTLLDAGFIDCGMGLFVSKKFREFVYFTLEVRLRK